MLALDGPRITVRIEFPQELQRRFSEKFERIDFVDIRTLFELHIAAFAERFEYQKAAPPENDGKSDVAERAPLLDEFDFVLFPVERFKHAGTAFERHFVLAAWPATKDRHDFSHNKSIYRNKKDGASPV